MASSPLVIDMDVHSTAGLYDYLLDALANCRSAFTQSSKAWPSCRPRCSYSAYARSAMRSLACASFGLILAVPADMGGVVGFEIVSLLIVYLLTHSSG